MEVQPPDRRSGREWVWPESRTFTDGEAVYSPLPQSTCSLLSNPADAESMDAELRQVANGFDYKTFYRCEEDTRMTRQRLSKPNVAYFKTSRRGSVQAVRDYYATAY
ncbi:hypothetical protein ZWY2020_019021 [Hordeum vulgare]|nr:hypothetical protein ZWY2020_019021 [Hordeum vulgare]